ncbi:MAG: Glycosyl transferase, family 39 [Candidatus Moranbacteria bacterium GW2011_GWE1_35_17]|nr:MAG: Glycosyl transferase, family 39 [Candidatus Moranbacteria bacterium GW2011_GWE1_35_17]KKP72504.1 MAG: Glycosyl transferase, family 39 [Candidatus Moranbacteria bacterium GW2011_GWE2_35_164]KKP84219.1 MAG: Glycosyl transferase, family 39 [Candidatus Moranbacteria bacterium GW2011_GWF2_35_54]KKP84460.1 MAG: Glycosyl transferase, family 39 [Candidatus Moranbacteria bacterium GW2011_GWF1_35_5]
MLKKQERIVTLLILFISVISFFSFGFYHLGKFETTDEHLWKYDRIPQYWKALKEKNWEETYINDKPGVTVALISGAGLLVEPDPKANQYLPAKNATEGKLFEHYNYQQSEITNFRFRLPILIFSSLSLLAFFYLILKAFDSHRVALLSTILIATNPILLGISQIINPDSFFWIFGGLSVAAYLAYLNTQKRKFLILCGLITGFALLSKYTAFMLFFFFILSALGKIIFQKEDLALKTNWQTLARYFLGIGFIFVISNIIFSIFLPATFVKPEYLFKGISQFLNLKIILVGIGLFLGFFALITWKKNIIGQITQQLSKQKKYLVLLPLALLSVLILISLLNVWTGQIISPVNELRDLAYINEPKEFNFKPLMDKKNGSILNNPQLYLMEAYPFIFSISPFLIVLIFFSTILVLKGKISQKSYTVLFSLSIFILFYFFSTLLAKIVTNARYSIILYPLIAIMGGIIIRESLNLFKLKTFKHFIITVAVIFILSIISLWQNKPFYFSYTSFLLPQEYTIHDSWGHGAYETAQYLNFLPQANDLVIWSNSDTVCRFFKGNCLKNRKIDLSVIQPDYFVISKRGALKDKNHFVLENNPNPQKDAQSYFENLETNYVWQIIINNRSDNYIKVIKF